MGKTSWYLLVQLILFHQSGQSCGVSPITDDPEELLDLCIDAKYHKSKPGPEDKLHAQCESWKDHSCCTHNTTLELHGLQMYGFQYDHCPGFGDGHLSHKCMKHFIQNNCFYECSPNIGPWVVKDTKKIRRERFQHVPLCAIDCNRWFNDCRHDYTCVENWGRDFKWIKGKSYCPDGSSCSTFEKVFHNSASFFCETVWDNDFTYTPDDEPCMRLWFTPEYNPNKRVAQLWKMRSACCYVVVLILLHFSWCSWGFSPITDDPDKLLNWCIDAKYHKKEPGPEDVLHKHCEPWRNRACCTHNTTVELHNLDMYGFQFNHCPKVGEGRLSPECVKHFMQDLCFYECSPNVGPWVIEVCSLNNIACTPADNPKKNIRRERFLDVPLCASDCNRWFEDCRNDYTCVENWSRDFEWTNGKARCPSGSTCRTFQEIYKNSSNFCEKVIPLLTYLSTAEFFQVWDHDWKYTADDEPCMRLWFSSDYNPNERVAQLRVRQLKGHVASLGLSAASLPSTLLYLLVALLYH
ncbi:unnamed protein product [Darwinula stevensoni]|uniref:Folate receptor-like domain-containing protein n=1 Tax=Darwinula stevensoni TaxID=69355 RepID=A0A7R8X2X3_9CRUS|nr:unnamed protein product [Darwinula stevensoni]CAG0881905.1 unnamed protein product [Darwinula stevensoni]